MTEMVIVVLIALLGFTGGIISSNDTYQQKCIAKYADMPHNQVEQHCKKLLKFEKDEK